MSYYTRATEHSIDLTYIAAGSTEQTTVTIPRGQEFEFEGHLISSVPTPGVQVPSDQASAGGGYVDQPPVPVVEVHPEAVLHLPGVAIPVVEIDPTLVADVPEVATTPDAPGVETGPAEEAPVTEAAAPVVTRKPRRTKEQIAADEAAAATK